MLRTHILTGWLALADALGAPAKLAPSTGHSHGHASTGHATVHVAALTTRRKSPSSHARPFQSPPRPGAGHLDVSHMMPP